MHTGSSLTCAHDCAGWVGDNAKARMAMLKLSMDHPDLLDAGVRDWDEASLGAANGRQKDMIPWQKQVTALQAIALDLWRLA